MKLRSLLLSVMVLMVILAVGAACTAPSTETSAPVQTLAIETTPTPAIKTVETTVVETTATATDVEKTPALGNDAISIGMPNPASVYCEARGYRLGPRTNADGGQYSVCVFPDYTECEEWAFFRGECQMGVDLTGWAEYSNPEYGFAFHMPPDWELEEVQGPDNTMAGHQVKLHIRPEANREIEMIISFRRVGEEQLIWPTGVGDGEFVDRGPAWLMAKPVKRNTLVCEGRDMGVYYQQEGGIRRGDLEFAIILGYVGSCTDGYSIPVEIHSLADAVVATFVLLP
jgi:putative hemolysin